MASLVEILRHYNAATRAIADTMRVANYVGLYSDVQQAVLSMDRDFLVGQQAVTAMNHSLAQYAQRSVQLVAEATKQLFPPRSLIESIIEAQRSVQLAAEAARQSFPPPSLIESIVRQSFPPRSLIESIIETIDYSAGTLLESLKRVQIWTPDPFFMALWKAQEGDPRAIELLLDRYFPRTFRGPSERRISFQTLLDVLTYINDVDIQDVKLHIAVAIRLRILERRLPNRLGIPPKLLSLDQPVLQRDGSALPFSELLADGTSLEEEVVDRLDAEFSLKSTNLTSQEGRIIQAILDGYSPEDVCQEFEVSTEELSRLLLVFKRSIEDV